MGKLQKRKNGWRKLCCFTSAKMLVLLVIIGFQNPISAKDLKEENTQITSIQQKETITGRVLDINNEPLIGVSVVLKGTTNGVLTDADGSFLLNVPNLEGTLEVSYVGFVKQTITIKGREPLLIIMKEDQQILDEVVVVGYGSQRKKDLTGGVTSINAEKLERIPATNIAQRLQGQLAGMNITVGTKPGATDESILIRGEKSLSGGNNPLIVLDGVPFSGKLTEIDQNSVENISVLKDASAAAIYGARAANGVILITTKKGEKGRTSIRYNGYVAVQTAERLFKTQNGAQNVELLKEFYRDMGYAESFWSDPTQFLPSLPKENYLAGKEFDWQDDLFGPAFQQEHQLSISGATDNSSYYASLSYTGQDGIIKGTDYKKYAVTLNLSHKFNDWLTIGTNTQLIQRDNGGVSPRVDQAFYLSPWSNPYNEDGTYNRYPMYTTTYWVNPYADSDGVVDDMNRNIFTSWYADIVLPIEGLSFRSNFGYNFRTQEYGSYYGKTTLKGEAVGGEAEIKNTNYSDWTWENVVKYDRNFGSHHLDVTAMMSAQETRDMQSTMKGQNFLNDNNAYFNIDAAQGQKTITSDKTETALASYMGRVNYNYASRYLLTLTGRYDGYSAFGKNNKWAFFPSVAVGWVASDEEFFKNWNIKPIDYLKVRLSYGANGNQGVKAYQTLTQLSQLDYIYGDGGTFAGGLYNGVEVGNPNLKWETTHSFNAGLDFSLFKNRLTGNVEVYSATTKDLLMKRTVPIMNGYKSMMDNIGKTNTKGFEITLNSLNIKNKDFEWTTSLVFAGNWNKIKSLREDGKDDISNSWFIGEGVKVFYDYKVVGIWQNSEIDEAAKYGAIPGDAKLQDTNNDGKITSDDRVIIGSKIPVWTAGLTNNFTYKNFTFSFFLNGVFDVTKENGMLNFIGRQFDKGTNYIQGVKYWTPENNSTEATRLGYNPKNSHKFYNDASFVRLQNVSLAYEFPKKISSSLSLERLSMYVNVSNVYTFSGVNKYGINPEQSVIGAPSSYPVPRTYVLGVNVTF
ncbi:MAG: TonB-dependent receptor [Prevotella sp.]|jgi:TonB-linked SusC/RagA family outer membrane protein|nr:TonB-dependent receptor [Prevotella sp.]